MHPKKTIGNNLKIRASSAEFIAIFVRFSLNISDILLSHQEEYRIFVRGVIVNMKTILTKEIRNIINRNGPNKLYKVSDFAHLNNDGLVTRALSRLEEEGILIRLSQGLYLYPLRNKFGILRPSIEEIAYAIADKDKARLIPCGLAALNKLGLSTQVTMNAVYLTDATARELTIGNRKIIFKRGVPRNFAYKTDLFPLIVAAMKELGKDGVTDEQVVIIKQVIEHYGNADDINNDYSMAPQWIKQRLAL